MLTVEVFVPLGSCACSFAPLIEKVSRATSTLKDLVEVRIRSITSKEALTYAIKDSCIIVDGVLRFSANFEEKQLEAAILRRNSIKK